MAVGTQDPVLGLTVMTALQADIRHCPAPILLDEAGHFVQEHGQAIAQAAVVCFCPDKMAVSTDQIIKAD